MFKVIIAGGRDFYNADLLYSTLDRLLLKKTNVQIVSGFAKGADSLALMYAADRNLPWKIFPADWDTHGKQAGYIRNKVMADFADACVCFWDGKSRGTADMIGLCRKRKIPLRVIRY